MAHLNPSVNIKGFCFCNYYLEKLQRPQITKKLTYHPTTLSEPQLTTGEYLSSSFSTCMNKLVCILSNFFILWIWNPTLNYLTCFSYPPHSQYTVNTFPYLQQLFYIILMLMVFHMNIAQCLGCFRYLIKVNNSAVYAAGNKYSYISLIIF